MPKSIRVKVTPEVFKWLRVSSGWSVEEVGNKLNAKPELIRRIEEGKEYPTLSQLKTLSFAYKRPLVAFFLPAPLPEKPKPKDYRMLPNRLNAFDRKTIYVIRRARGMQEACKLLSGNIAQSTNPSFEKTNLHQTPEVVAAGCRSAFGMTEEKQKKYKTAYEVYNDLRMWLENNNIFVFQFSMPVDDARGFSLTDDTPNVIVINSKDSVEARLFTLMHEFGHVLLGQTVIDLPDPVVTVRDDVESWCNEFASAFLLPADMAKDLFGSGKGTLTTTSTLDRLSRRYKVSKAMLLYNMYKLRFITRKEYEEVLGRFTPLPIEPVSEDDDEEDEKSGAVPVYKSCLARVGNKFVSIIANNYDKNLITFTDALNHLSIKAKNFDKVLAEAKY